MKQISPLFGHAYDGRLFYRAVMKRLTQFPDTSLSELCRIAGIEFSTTWRWKQGSKPCTDTVNAIEAAFHKLERRAAH